MLSSAQAPNARERSAQHAALSIAIRVFARVCQICKEGPIQRSEPPCPPSQLGYNDTITTTQGVPPKPSGLRRTVARRALDYHTDVRICPWPVEQHHTTCLGHLINAYM